MMDAVTVVLRVQILAGAMSAGHDDADVAGDGPGLQVERIFAVAIAGLEEWEMMVPRWGLWVGLGPGVGWIWLLIQCWQELETQLNWKQKFHLHYRGQ